MTLAVGDHLILPLPRPQYVAVPEALLTSLVWSWWTETSPGDATKTQAYLYKTEARSTKTLDYHSTEPVDDRLVAFGQALSQVGLVAEGDQTTLARAVARGIAGIRSERGRTQAATPFSPAIALLQNMEGLQGAANPPNVAKILETLFGLGTSGKTPSSGVASLWREACDRRIAVDPLVSILHAAASRSLLSNRVLVEGAPQTAVAAHAWSGLLDDTPFSWFAGTWQTLTGDAWTQALPPRTWVDWSSTVLRLALGLGFLWEAAFTETAARLILRRQEPLWNDLRAEMPDVLPWRSARAGTSIRDVASLLSWRTRRGQVIRKHLESWLDSHEARQEELPVVFRQMGKDEALAGELADALGARPSGNDNTYEAIKYALRTRDAGGDFPDHYGLLRASGRYLVPEPGPDWIAVVASLACPGPDGESDLGAVAKSLAALGLSPELADLVVLLEKAGMARGSADADQGVVVRSAF